jgi:uncharacterized protein
MLYKLNGQGYVINEASLKKIQRDYLAVLEELKLETINRLGNDILSIYIRGSVSVGRAKKNLSDVDFITITKKKISTQRLFWINNFSNKLRNKYNFIPFFDITVISFDELLSSPKIKNLKTYLKTQSVCLYGKNILGILPPVKPGRELAVKMYADMDKELQTLKNIFSGKLKNRKYLNKKMPTKFWCVWAMRLLLRSGLGLVMIEKPLYSQDLKTCYQLFSQYFPEYKKQMHQALKWSKSPTSDKRKLLNYLNNFGSEFIKLWNKTNNYEK